MGRSILGKELKQWIEEYPLLADITHLKEVFWLNPNYQKNTGPLPFTIEDIREAEERLIRFAPYIARAFPETAEHGGIIESPLVPIPNMKRELEKIYQNDLPGQLLLKCDSHLPISGSIKARGGIYEVLEFAEEVAIKHKKLAYEDDYSILADQKFKDLFSRYSISVGSTGNLGLSIGIMSAKLGFKVFVHMSADAKQWKKDLLREKGVTVVEHNADFSEAVAQGRKQAEKDPNMHFVDDESSRHLFLGYATAAGRIKKQLEDLEITVDENHPLFVYLPCGVGGGPGGVTFGLKQVFGNHVHCLFSEPTHSPSMLLGLLTGMHDKVSVQDFGIDNKTEADGLAVGRPSELVGKIIDTQIGGVCTVEDNHLFACLSLLAAAEDLNLEPSALAGFAGYIHLLQSQTGKVFIEKQGMDSLLDRAVHIIWGTGGSMVPESEMKAYIENGQQLIHLLNL